MSSIMLLITIIIALVITGISLFYIIKTKNKGLSLALSFILSGTIGNMIDRVLFRYVRDFIAIGTFPAFNMADVFNITGVVLLIVTLLKRDNQKI